MWKCKIGILERWQRRYFRLQGRVLYYFKKDKGEPPCGFIPLLDVKLKDLPPKKGRKYGFVIKIMNTEKLNVKRDEYLINAETAEQRVQWKAKIVEKRAKILVGQPYSVACTVSPKDNNVNLLVPYFITPVFDALNQSGYKLRGIWTIDVPKDTINNMMFQIDQNFLMPVNDLHNCAGAMLEYFKSLPESLFPSDQIPNLCNQPTPAAIRGVILQLPAPIRQILKILASHFNKLIENSSRNGLTKFTIISAFGPIIIRPKDSSVPAGQVKNAQEQIISAFLTNYSELFEDIHQFLDAPQQPVTRRARLSSSLVHQNEDILEGTRGLLVNVVRTDSLGWCTVFTSSRRVGLVHENCLIPLSDEEQAEINNGTSVDALVDNLLDTVREKVPEMMLLFDSMYDECLQIKTALTA
ncbi:Variant SH3 domain containing protein [Histomonas meleagridis]|uniref:Variant SH3 domain containing protein n=1 Tax=Histomonas meleagridis TaxID=135588 RepID=UPI00355A4959|nr:Variant SH3 domain containing protein [Histomonas meleagridis]KAH0801483.1 Variant SH3 domain containing protein [Histomonas meleagridis]